jgi:hypothetical protein
MATDRDEWRGDFKSAEDRRLEASLAATPSQRLKWLEEALAFAARVGALEHIAPEDGAAVDSVVRRRN